MSGELDGLARMVSYSTLARVTSIVTGDPSWHAGRVWLQRLPVNDNARWGRAERARVLFPPSGGPLWVVAHELAHVSAWSDRYNDHGPVWRAEFERIARLIVTLGLA